jgi:single-stranded-DNA-specific exonuclease
MKRYEIRESMSKEAREKLKEYSDLVAELLYHRDIDTPEKAKDFFEFSYEKLHNPNLLKDIDKASDRIKKALDNNEKICVFADYDADGIPGAVIMSDFLTKVGCENFEIYIPHRNNEGFGLNKKAVEKIKESGARLIITVDCGIADVEEIDLINELGMDVIITDHHEPNGKDPKAYAIVNPKQDDCKYPDKNLCGSGVAFKLVQGYLSKYGNDIPDGWEKNLLDMVGIATLSDMVPLQGENRILAKYGLTILQMTPRRGLLKLYKLYRVNQRNITEDDVGFTITPRINAASRMDEPKLAFDLLSSKEEVESEILAKKLDKMNDERKGHVAAIIKEIKKDLGDQEMNVVVAGSPKWKPSLMGLVANSLVESYNAPAFIWGRGEGEGLKGSCRTNGLSLLDIMNKVDPKVIESYGGHEGAGGFVVKADSVDFLKDELSKAVEELSKEKKENLFFIDKQLELKDVDERLYKEIEALGPFGVGNHKPFFLFESVTPEEIKVFGKQKNHTSIVFKENRNVKTIAFFKTPEDFSIKIEEGKPINLVGQIEKSYFMNRPELRIKVEDLY